MTAKQSVPRAYASKTRSAAPSPPLVLTARAARRRRITPSVNALAA